MHITTRPDEQSRKALLFVTEPVKFHLTELDNRISLDLLANSMLLIEGETLPCVVGASVLDAINWSAIIDPVQLACTYDFSSPFNIKACRSTKLNLDRATRPRTRRSHSTLNASTRTASFF